MQWSLKLLPPTLYHVVHIVKWFNGAVKLNCRLPHYIAFSDVIELSCKLMSLTFYHVVRITSWSNAMELETIVCPIILLCNFEQVALLHRIIFTSCSIDIAITVNSEVFYLNNTSGNHYSAIQRFFRITPVIYLIFFLIELLIDFPSFYSFRSNSNTVIFRLTRLYSPVK